MVTCCITMTELLLENTVISCSSAHASASSSAAWDSPVSSRKQSLSSAGKDFNDALKREKKKRLVFAPQKLFNKKKRTIWGNYTLNGQEKYALEMFIMLNMSDNYNARLEC